MPQTMKKIFTPEELDGEPEVATARIASLLYTDTVKLDDDAMVALPVTVLQMLCIGYLALYAGLDLDEDVTNDLLH